jgi:hypothetical protein
LTFEEGQIGCPEISVRDFHNSLRNFPEEISSTQRGKPESRKSTLVREKGYSKPLFSAVKEVHASSYSAIFKFAL